MKLTLSFGIAQRLYGLAAGVTLAVLATAAFTQYELRDAMAKARQAAGLRLPQLTRVSEAELEVTRASLQLRHAMLARTPQELAATLADVLHRRAQAAKKLSEYESAVTSELARKRFAPVPPLAARFSQIATENVALIEAGQKAEAFAFLVDKTIPARNELLAALGGLKSFQAESLSAEMAIIEAELQSTLIILLATFAAIVIGLVAVAVLVARTLQRRVRAARTFAECVREGDLTHKVVDSTRDELSPLLSAMADMQAALAMVVGDVRRNADSLATASAQIAQGNLDLSQRTEQQASSLQQTAATMEELGSTARSNTENARQADDLAQSACGVAEQGGEVVQRVVQTMKGISESSRRIADIISTIDGIAFQTNILALNAAVEAARAGEQGRGFAVVASEVRTLAQRSAAAAREIKVLITASVERVEQGATLVDQAGRTMSDVMASVRRVSGIVGAISSASVQQNTGVQQVGEAVTQMDQVTQQNAALVEESAAAAQSLKMQAATLAQVVSVFKVPA